MSNRIILVLLPGLDGTARLFRDFAAAFGDEVELMPLSYPTDRPLGYADLEAIVRPLLPQDRPYFLLAESFSGPVGISIAASSPSGLLGLVLCCSFARTPVSMAFLFRALVRLVPLSMVPVRLLGFFLLGRFASKGRLASLAEALALVASPVLRARALAVLSVDMSVQLAQVTLPLLYLRAAEDRLVSCSSSEWVASVAKQTQVLDFDAPHFLLQVQPKLAAEQVKTFMARQLR